MKKAEQNILNRFYDTFTPVQISDYKNKYSVTDLEMKYFPLKMTEIDTAAILLSCRKSQNAMPNSWALQFK